MKANTFALEARIPELSGLQWHHGGGRGGEEREAEKRCGNLDFYV